jgi:hypothetical protein
MWCIKIQKSRNFSIVLIYHLVYYFIPEYNNATGQGPTPETVADRQGQQGDDPERGSAKESRVMLKQFGREVLVAPHAQVVTYPLHGRATTMVTVKEITWEEASAPGFEQTTRQAWREAVAEIADKARAKLPGCSSRVYSAVKLVLAGDVELQADGTAKVASQSNGSMVYHVANGVCSCHDFTQAPHRFCKHRLAAAITRRAQELMKAKVDAAIAGSLPTPAQPGAPTAPLPEVPVSITLKATLHGHEAMVTLRGVDFASVKAQVE